MRVKTKEGLSNVPRSNQLHRPAAPVDQATPLSSAELVDLEQLSRQAERILEQLISLDEHYHEVIKHDASALEALSACTVALSKLAHVRSI